MGDLLVITPSRGRPRNAARLLEAVHKTAKLDTSVFLLLDEDDEELTEYKKVFTEKAKKGDELRWGPRMGLAEWTNYAATLMADDYDFFASLGDDMVPKTPGWDRALINAIQDMGGTGFAYPWDGIREDIPEAVIMSSDIVKALGWMALPELRHFWIDDVWGDLGRQAGCIRHSRTVKIDHLHPAAGKASSDTTYRESRMKIEADREAYHKWHKTRMREDAEIIIRLRENSPGAVPGDSGT